MLFKPRFVPGLLDGTTRVTFRAWKRPQVREGGEYRIPDGTLIVDSIGRQWVSELTETDAQASGNRSLQELHAFLGDAREVYRIEFHVRPGEPVKPAANLTADDALERVQRMDASATKPGWASRALALIDRHPGRRAPDLAEIEQRPTQPFKADVRRLKALGLTESLEVGYRLTSLGREVLQRLGDVGGRTH